MLDINNEQSTKIRKGLERIERAYSQSIDGNVRLAVKESVFLSLVDSVYGFDTAFEEAFEKCKMDSLIEITELQDYVFQNLNVAKMPQLTAQVVKRLFKKLPEKHQKRILQDYNEKSQKHNLTYYSLQLDNTTKVYIYNNNGDLGGEICKISASGRGISESSCCFCNELRIGQDIAHISRIIKTGKGNYSSKMVSCCSDELQCNHDIVNREKFDEFFK